MAHEYLLIAEDYTFKRGDTYYVHLFVAQGLNVELERPLQKAITKNFSLITSNENRDLLLLSKEDQLPVIEAIVDFDGLALITMQRDFSKIEFMPEAFAEYLKTDHLENINFDPALTNTPQREKYSRYLKALLLSGDNAGGDLYKKEVGYNLEITLLDNPYLLNENNELRAKNLFRGMPLINKIVTFRNRQGEDNTISLTTKTDEAGIASIVIPKTGTWVIHLTHMIPCLDKTDCDWESFWTSYSFAID
jgi:hypothetical protein